MICYSISQIKDVEQRKKMANSVLIVGGGCQIYNFVDEMEDRLIEKFADYDSNIDRVEVLESSNRDIPPWATVWIGGTVLPRLDSMKDLWITKTRWLGFGLDEMYDDEDGTAEKKTKKEKSSEYGMRYLKEKIAFQW